MPAQPALHRSHFSHLSVDGVSFGYPDRRVLSDVSFTARDGDRLGLVGENGTGKSTLLRIIAGELAPDAGLISRPDSVAMLAQQLRHTADTPVSRVLDDAQREALDARARIEALGEQLANAATTGEHTHPTAANNAADALAEAYAAALEQAERTDAWAIEARRADVLTGLGLGGVSPARQVGQLSGGQQLRLALASVLLQAPHTLLLDEPSNHLDDRAVSYLEQVLSTWRGIVIFASHDRALLDNVATKILDLDPARPHTQQQPQQSTISANDLDAEDPGAGLGARLWGMGYSATRAAQAEERRRWHQQYAAQLEEHNALAHEISVGSREVNKKHESKSEAKITRKFYADKDARVTARRARNARVRLDALEREWLREPPEPLRFRGFERNLEARHDAQPQPVLRAERVSKLGRLAEVSLELPPAGRLLLAGPNGVGKSTLLAILADELAPDHGALERNARIGYLPQEVEFETPHKSAADAYRRIVGDEIAELLPLHDTGLLAPRDLTRPVAELSVGQRRRLTIATLVADPPPILLLDEPTNHLSLTLVEDLESALQDFSGALIIASHDRWLRSRWDGEVLHLTAPAASVMQEA